MFDFVHQRKRAVQIIMGLATLPFLFWGIESYRDTGSDDTVAQVAGEKIQRQEFDQALRDQQESMRAALGEKIDAAILDSPEARAAALEKLIQQRLLRLEAGRVGLTVPDAQLVDVIRDIPAFQQNGQFSNQLYEELLRNQGMTPVRFEARVRRELMQLQLSDAYTRDGFIPDSVAERIQRLNEEQREISLASIQPEQFLAQTKADDAAIKSYYDGHQAEFHLPERVRVEYLVLSINELAKQVQLGSGEALKYFEEHAAEFGQPEERQASHILISVAAGASAADKEAARAKAEQLLAQIRQSPQSFAELARQNSQDPGSAVKGGDLGFFGHGMMVKAFEDVVFQMKLDEIRGPVETDFGFHIIKLTAIKAGKPVHFDEVKSQIEQDLRKQKAAKTFGEMAEGFGNTVYEQSDSLRPAADKFGLIIMQSGWIERGAGEASFFANERLLQAIFSEDALQDKRNTEAIEVTPGTLVSARVLEHRQAEMRPLAEVRDEIGKRVARQQTGEMAAKEGRDKLARLQGGETTVVAWGTAQLVSRKESHGLDSEVLRAAFRAATDKLPAYVGTANAQGGYTLIRVNRVSEPGMADTARRAAIARELQQLLAQEEFTAYLAALRQRSDVTVNAASIEKKQ